MTDIHIISSPAMLTGQLAGSGDKAIILRCYVDQFEGDRTTDLERRTNFATAVSLTIAPAAAENGLRLSPVDAANHEVDAARASGWRVDPRYGDVASMSPTQRIRHNESLANFLRDQSVNEAAVRAVDFSLAVPYRPKPQPAMTAVEYDSHAA